MLVTDHTKSSTPISRTPRRKPRPRSRRPPPCPPGFRPSSTRSRQPSGAAFDTLFVEQQKEGSPEGARRAQILCRQRRPAVAQDLRRQGRAGGPGAPRQARCDEAVAACHRRSTGTRSSCGFHDAVNMAPAEMRNGWRPTRAARSASRRDGARRKRRPCQRPAHRRACCASARRSSTTTIMRTCARWSATSAATRRSGRKISSPRAGATR